MKPATSVITFRNRWDHFLARWRINRSGHRTEPGLYSLGNPTADSPVFVTANYTLSFDAVRSALQGIDGYILVLDTNGINVWCAAGKGTFGTGELVNRIGVTHLDGVVRHRKLLLPQLGAAGVAAHEVRKRSGFKVEYGPVRAADLPEYLKTGQATPEMRRVRFDLADRIILIPVELMGVLLPMLGLAVVLYFLAGGLWASLGVVSAILAGVVLFPILLPWLPTRDFSAKGFILGGVVALILFLVRTALRETDAALWWQVGNGLSYILVWSPVTAFVALNFTGSTTFTSKSGVQREMFRYMRIMAGVFIVGIVLSVVLHFI
ncbi:MAG: carbon monoxide dehydrogenase [Chloroflexi bacterium]|nr:carbon monoxide dehydrogenase [Chloroflexota bacterium]